MNNSCNKFSIEIGGNRFSIQQREEVERRLDLLWAMQFSFARIRWMDNLRRKRFEFRAASGESDLVNNL